jgi:beta-phosphoglucomutase-like phosphatase (HAD superfamily)
VQPSAEEDLSKVRVLLCDADGTLFPSEGPAFDASVTVTNRFLAWLGSDRRFRVDELHHVSLGRNFRSLAGDLVAERGVAPEPHQLDDWVAEELEVVTAHLVEVLSPDPRVGDPLRSLADGLELAVVSSSALSRVLACLEATGLGDLFPTSRVLSAQDSLPEPSSKPDPAVYSLALVRLGVAPGAALAVEDAVPGVQSAVAAGVPTVGMIQFVPREEMPARREALLAAGAREVFEDWSRLARRLANGRVLDRAS